MKQITNWKNATVVDFEADGLLDEATKIHVMSCQMQGKQVVSLSGSTEKDRIVGFFRYHIDNGIPIVAHSGIGYDVPLAEKILGIDLSKLMVIDSLALSWYLNMERNSHGLDSFHADYGIAKPKIDDWENLTYEEYKHRCEEDVKINKALWEDFKERLIEMYTLAQLEIDEHDFGGKRMYEGEVIYVDQFKGGSVESAIDRILTFLMFKMDCARLQETTGWDIDGELLEKSISEMEKETQKIKDKLESVMPVVPKYAHKKKPSKPFLKNGDLSASGKSWEEVKEKFRNKEKDEYGNLLVKTSSKEGHLMVLAKYEEPNAGSSSQVKDFLFSKGWKPVSFKYERDEEAFESWIKKKPRKGADHNAWSHWKSTKPEDRKIPQITISGDNGKELCPSVEDLAEEVPEIRLYAEYNVAKHRLSVLKGFQKAANNNKLKARISGFTNTLRVCHSEIVNLPGVDKPYGDVVRGVLVAGEGYTLVGSDLASLEDRTKHSLMLPHDPDYVSDMMSPDFDPHISTALFAGMITQKEFDDFKNGIKPMHVIKARKAGKCTNYASVYGAGAAKIAQAAGVSEAEGKKLHEGYWKLNWAVLKIAEEQAVIKTSRNESWLVNPVNGFCYNLRSEKDRFSTLAQGTGSFYFDMWVDNILEEQYERFGKRTLTGSFHDENIFKIKDTQKARGLFADMIQRSIDKVNKTYNLRRDLGCESQFGYRYSAIH